MNDHLGLEHGWYWAEDVDGGWWMAFVDEGDETVMFFDPEDPKKSTQTMDFDEIPACMGIVRWLGRINCPGGDFGSVTVIADAELHGRAKAEGKAIVITHIDYYHCRDGCHSSITTTETMPRVEADKRLRAEADRL